MPLVTHVGGAINAKYSGLESVALIQIESNYVSRRAVWWLIFAGVFERHPGLKYVDHRDTGQLVPAHRRRARLDPRLLRAEAHRAAERCVARAGAATTQRIHANNVFFGASFASAFEVEQAILHGLDSQLLWGSDYPHFESTFVHRTCATCRR